MATILQQIRKDDEDILAEALRRLQGNSPYSSNRQARINEPALTINTPQTTPLGNRTPRAAEMTSPTYASDVTQDREKEKDEDDRTPWTPGNVTAFDEALQRLRGSRLNQPAQTPVQQTTEPTPTPITLSGSFGTINGMETDRGNAAGLVDAAMGNQTGMLAPHSTTLTPTTSRERQNPLTLTQRGDEPKTETPAAGNDITLEGLQPLSDDLSAALGGQTRRDNLIRGLTDRYNQTMADIRRHNYENWMSQDEVNQAFRDADSLARERIGALEAAGYQDIDYYGIQEAANKQAENKLIATATERAQAVADDMAAQVPGITAEDRLVYGGDRLRQYVNPFSGLDTMQADLERATGMLAQIEPGSLNDQVNGELARQTVAELQRRMAAVEDPDKALEDVRSDLEQLRALQQRTTDWNQNADLQQVIWQQERQEQLLDAYVRLRDASDDERDAARQAYDAWRERYEGDHGDLRWSADMIRQGQQSQQEYIGLYRGMTEEENLAYWLLHNEDPAKADAYMAKLAADINKRNYQAAQGNLQQAAADNPWLVDAGGSVLATVVEPFKATEGINTLYKHFTGQEIDPYSTEYAFTLYQNQIRPAVKNDITARIENAGGSTWLQYAAGEAYDLTENVLDNVFRNLTFGWTGAPSWLSTGAMALGTIPQNMLEIDQSTVNVNQQEAMLTAGLRATSEFLTEALSDAHMFEAMRVGMPDDPKLFQRIGREAVNMAIGASVEGSTEVLNDIAVDQLDKLWMQEEGRYNQAVDSYYRAAIASGQFADADEAYAWANEKATADTINNYLHTLVFSTVSGGLMDIMSRVTSTTPGELTDNRNGSHDTLQGAQHAAEGIAGANAPGDGGATGMTPSGLRLRGEQLRQELAAERQDKEREYEQRHAAGDYTDAEYQSLMDGLNKEYSEEEAAQRLSRNTPQKPVIPNQRQEQQYEAPEQPGGFAASDVTAESLQEDDGQTLEDVARELLGYNDQQQDQQGNRKPNLPPLPAQQEQRQEQQYEAPEPRQNYWGWGPATPEQQRLWEAQRNLDYAIQAQKDNPAGTYNGITIPADAVGVDRDGNYYTSIRELRRAMRQQHDEHMKQLNQALRDGSITREYYDAQRAMYDRIYSVDYAKETLEDRRQFANLNEERYQRRVDDARAEVEEAQAALLRRQAAEDTERRQAGQENAGAEEDTEHRQEGRPIEQRDNADLERAAADTAEAERRQTTQQGEETEGQRTENGAPIEQRGNMDLERLAAEAVEAERRQTTQQGEETEGQRTENGAEITQQGENTAQRTEGEETEGAHSQTLGEEEDTGHSQTGTDVVYTSPNMTTITEGEEAEGNHRQTLGEEQEGGHSQAADQMGQQTGNEAAGRPEGAQAEGTRDNRTAGEEAEGQRTATGEGIPENRGNEAENSTPTREDVEEMRHRVTEDEDGNRVVDNQGAMSGEEEGQRAKQNQAEQNIVNAVRDVDNAGVVLGIVEDAGLDTTVDKTVSTEEDEQTVPNTSISESTETDESTQTGREWWTEEQQTTNTNTNAQQGPVILESETITGDYMYMTVDQVTTQRQTVQWVERAYEAGKQGQNFNLNDIPVTLREGGQVNEVITAAQRAYEAGQAELAAQRQETAQRTETTARQLGYTFDSTGKAGKNGVNFVSVTGEVSESANAQLRILDQFGKQYGLKFNVYDSLGNRNAAYVGGRTVNIALDADEGALVRAASHEAYHYIQQYNEAAASEISDYVLERLQASPGYDLTARIQQVNDQYARSGETQTDALQEIVADSMIDVIADPETIRIAMTQQGYFSGTVQNIAQHIQQVGTWLKNAVQKLAGHSQEVQALHEDAEYVAEVGKRLQAAVQQATFNRRARQDGSGFMETDQSGISNRFYNRLENGTRWADALRQMVDEVYETTQQARGDTRNRTEARPELVKAMGEFIRQEKSLNKALEDHGFRAVDGQDNDLTVWAARRLEQGQQGAAVEAYLDGSLASAHYDDFTDWIDSTEHQFSWLDDTYTDFAARDLVNKLFTMTKQGIAWAGQQEQGTIRAGEWSEHLKEFVSQLKSTTQTRMGQEALTNRIRSMYLALDNSLMKGDDFSIGTALRYAQPIAEEMANRAGTKVDNLTDDYLTDFARRVRNSTIYLTETQQDEARQRYDSVQGLIRAYYGTARFTTTESRGTTTLEGLASEYAPLFDGGDMNEGDLFERFDTLMEQYARQRDNARQVVYEGGLTRSQLENDATMRIIWGYFNLPGSVTQQAEKATRGKSKTLEDFRNAIKEARKEFDSRRAELEAEYAKLTADQTKQNQEQLAHEKNRIEAEINRENEKYLETYRAKLKEAQATAAAAGERITAAELAKAEANVQLQNALARTDQLQEQMEAEIQKRVDAYKETMQGILNGMLNGKEANERTRQAVRDRVESIRNAQHRQNLRNTVVRQLNRMEQGLLKPTDKKHIPEAYRSGIIKALQTVDTSSVRKQDSQRSIAFKELQTILQQMEQEDPLAIIDPDMQVSLANLATVAEDKRVMDMSIDQLQELSDVLSAMQRMMDNYDKMITDRHTEITKTFTEPIRQIAENRRARPLARTALGQTLRDQVEGSLLDPKRWTQWLGRATNENIGNRIWNLLHGGLDQQIRDVQTAERLMAEAMDGVDKKTMREMYGQKAKTLTLHTMQGDLNLSIGQVMEIYMGMQRKQYENHLLGVQTPHGRAGGGITLAPTKTKNGVQQQVRAMHVTEAQVQELIGQLTPEQKKLAEKMRPVLDWCSKIGNETSMQLYGYNKYREKNYYPIHVESNYNSQTVNQDFSNPMYKLKNQGFTKQLIEKANAPIRVGNLFDTVTDHVVQMINYHAWVNPVMDMTRILNNKNMEEYEDENGETHERVNSTTSEDLQVLMGQNGKSYALQLLRDINGIAQDEIEKKGSGLSVMALSRFKAAAVSWNLSTAAKQPWSVVRGFDVIPGHYFLPGRVNGCTEKIDDLMEKYAPIYAWKQYGNFTMETGKSLQAILLPQTQGAVEDFSEKGMALAGMADNMTWRNIWRAAEKMTAARNTDLKAGTEEFYRQAAQYFNECIDQTQVVDSILHRTQIMRGKGMWTKAVTSFMGEPLKTFNTFMDKARAVAEDPSRDNFKAFAKTSTVYLASAGVQAVVASMISALRHMADDEPTKDKFLRYLFGFGNEDEWNHTDIWNKIWGVYTSNIGSEVGLISKVPVLRDVLEILQGFSAERSDLSVVQAIYDSGTKLFKALNDRGTVALPKAVSDFAGTLANTLGIPAGNVLNECWHLTNWIPRGLEEAFGVDTLDIQYARLKAAREMSATQTTDEYVRLMEKAEHMGRMDLYHQIEFELVNSGIKEETLAKKIQAFKAKQLGLQGTLQSDMAGGYVDALLAGDKDKADKIKETFMMTGKESSWDSKLVQEVRELPQVGRANELRRAGDISGVQEVIQELRSIGIPEEAIIKGITSEYNAEKDDEGNVIKWGSATSSMNDAAIEQTPNAASVGIWAYADLDAVIREGNLDDAKLLVGYLQTQGKSDQSIRSSMTQRFKQLYHDDPSQRNMIKQMLMGLGIGYTEKTIDGWAK